MVKAYRLIRIFPGLGILLGIGHGGGLLQNTGHTARAGHGFGQGDDQRGQLNELHGDLEHIVVQRHHIALGDGTDVHPEGRPVDEDHGSKVDEHIGQRVQQGGNFAHKLIELGQGLAALVKLPDGMVLPAEGADHPHAGEVLPGQAGHPVQSGLSLPVQRDAAQHNGKDGHKQHGNDHRKDPGTGYIDGEGHNHSAEDHKGAAQQQPQAHIDAGLDLVDVVRQPGDHGVGPQGIQLRKGEALDMVKYRLPQVRRKAGTGLGRKELGRNAGRKAQQSHKDQDQEAPDHIAPVIARHADIDHAGNYQWDHQVKHDFQQLEQRGQDALLGVPLQVTCQFFHICRSYCIFLIDKHIIARYDSYE